MEIQVKVVKILPQERFVSQKTGNEFVKNSFVAETLGQYKKTIKFDVPKAESWDKMAITEGATYNVSFEVESREYNGKYFTSVNVWKTTLIANAETHAEAPKKESKPQPAPNPQPKTPIQTPKNEPKAEEDSDLPF